MLPSAGRLLSPPHTLPSLGADGAFGRVFHELAETRAAWRGDTWQTPGPRSLAGGRGPGAACLVCSGFVPRGGNSVSSQKKSDHYWCIWMLSREACCLGATNLPNQTGAGAGPGRARAGRHPLPSAECPGPHLPGTWGRSQLVPGEPRPGDRPRRSTGGRHRAKAAAPRASPPSPPSPPPGWHLVSLKREGACPPASPS